MKHTPLNRAARLALTALLSATALAPLSAQAQTWEYKSYKKSGLGGQYSKDNFVVGSVSLAEKDGKATFSTNAGAMDACRRAEVPAQVTRTDTEITIEPEVPMAGSRPDPATARPVTAIPWRNRRRPSGESLGPVPPDWSVMTGSGFMAANVRTRRCPAISRR